MSRARSARYTDYRGEKKFNVRHPDFGSVTVTAPDADSAMVVAADFWKTAWTRIDFYTRCEVSKA